MPEYHDQLGTGQLRGKFQTAQDIGIDEITCYACSKDIAQALIKHHFGWNTAVYATHHDSKGCLLLGGVLQLFE